MLFSALWVHTHNQSIVDPPLSWGVGTDKLGRECVAKRGGCRGGLVSHQYMKADM